MYETGDLAWHEDFPARLVYEAPCKVSEPSSATEKPCTLSVRLRTYGDRIHLEGAVDPGLSSLFWMLSQDTLLRNGYRDVGFLLISDLRPPLALNLRMQKTPVWASMSLATSLTIKSFLVSFVPKVLAICEVALHSVFDDIAAAKGMIVVVSRSGSVRGIRISPDGSWPLQHMFQTPR